MYFYAMSHFSGGRVRASDLVFAWQVRPQGRGSREWQCAMYARRSSSLVHVCLHQAWNEDEGYAGLSLDQRNEILFQAQTAYFVALVMVQVGY
jgi:hypothetical protein